MPGAPPPREAGEAAKQPVVLDPERRCHARQEAAPRRGAGPSELPGRLRRRERLGGDEFVLVLGDIVKTREAIEVVARIEERLRVPFRIGNLQISVAASVGIALSDGSGQGSAEDLVRAADAAMYEAKRGGKDRHKMFDGIYPCGSAGRRVVFGRRGLTGIDVGGLRVGAPALPLLRSAVPGGGRRTDGPSGRGGGLG